MSGNTAPPPEVHPEKIPDFNPINSFGGYGDVESTHSCWLHITKCDDGQRVARFEFDDHHHEEDIVLCVPLDLDDDSWRAINSQLITDAFFGRALYQNALNDLATQIVRQLEHNALGR